MSFLKKIISALDLKNIENQFKGDYSIEDIIKHIYYKDAWKTKTPTKRRDTPLHELNADIQPKDLQLLEQNNIVLNNKGLLSVNPKYLYLIKEDINAALQIYDVYNKEEYLESFNDKQKALEYSKKQSGSQVVDRKIFLEGVDKYILKLTKQKSKDEINLVRNYIDEYETHVGEKWVPWFMHKREASFNKLEVLVGSEKNPDFKNDSYNPIIKNKKIQVKSIAEAVKICKKFIDDNQVGSGNWYAADAGWIFQDGKKIARVAYNGRVFDMNEKEIDLSAYTKSNRRDLVYYGWRYI